MWYNKYAIVNKSMCIVGEKSAFVGQDVFIDATSLPQFYLTYSVHGNDVWILNTHEVKICKMTANLSAKESVAL